MTVQKGGSFIAAISISYTSLINIAAVIAVITLLYLSLRKKENADASDKLTGKLTAWAVVLSALSLVILSVSFFFQKQLFTLLYGFQVEMEYNVHCYMDVIYYALMFGITLLARKGLLKGTVEQRARAGADTLILCFVFRFLTMFANLFEINALSSKGVSYTAARSIRASFTNITARWLDLVVLILLAVAAGIAIARKKQAEKDSTENGMQA